LLGTRCAVVAGVIAAAFCWSCQEQPQEAPPAATLVTIDVAPLIEALATDDLFESDPAINRLAALGDAVVPTLANALKSDNKQQRLAIIEVLGDIGTESAQRVLVGAAGDSDAEVRADVIQSVGYYKIEAGTQAVERALDDPDMRVVRTAINACIFLCRSSESLEGLFRLGIQGQPRLARMLPPETLSRLRAREDIRDALNSALSAQVLPRLTPETEPEVRVRAALLIARTDRPAALPWLIDFAEHGSVSVLRVNAVLAIGESASPDDLPALTRLSASDDRLVRASACRALDRLIERDAAVDDAAFAHCPARDS
jgi:HEAT repeat protein